MIFETVFITAQLAFNLIRRTFKGGMILEGGAIEINGAGQLLTTEAVLLILVKGDDSVIYRRRLALMANGHKTFVDTALSSIKVGYRRHIQLCLRSPAPLN